MKENNKEKKNKYSLVDSVKSNIKMTFSESVKKAIKSACILCGSKEWSAIIFYKVGNLENGFENIVINIFDMLIMDIGTEVHTSWEYNDDINDYMIDRGMIGDDGVCMGQLHSHVNMNAYFSNEDMGTMKQEAIDREHNLSVVVNNNGAVVAKISRKVKKTYNGDITIEYPTFGENTYTETIKANTSSYIIEYHDVSFVEELDNFTSSRIKTLKDRIEKENAERRKKESYKMPNLFNGVRKSGPTTYETSVKKFFNTLLKKGAVNINPENKTIVFNTGIMLSKDFSVLDKMYDDSVLATILDKIVSGISSSILRLGIQEDVIMEFKIIIKRYRDNLFADAQSFDLSAMEMELSDASGMEMEYLYVNAGNPFEKITGAELAYVAFSTSDAVIASDTFKFILKERGIRII